MLPTDDAMVYRGERCPVLVKCHRGVQQQWVYITRDCTVHVCRSVRGCGVTR
jgi:hypothetical protein